MTLQVLIDQVGAHSSVLEALAQGLADGAVVAVVSPQERAALQPVLAADLPPDLQGPALVLGSGGSSGGRQWCLQPVAQVQQAARATAQWLTTIGLDPGRCELFDPLPLHHISGLMPWVRARQWGAALRCLPPELMRDPLALATQQPVAADRPALLSLVPTQLERLLGHPAGVDWLKGFAVVWVGGAALTQSQAQRCREWDIRLSPCYGSTETAAMVTALPPEQFLEGIDGCGQPLPHVELRVDPSSSALQVRSASLALARFQEGCWQPLLLEEGWWSSGDRAALNPAGLQVLGRLDGAIQSGGETVFPEQLEGQLLALCQSQGVALGELLLLPEPDPLWGERLVALVRPLDGAPFSKLVPRLQDLVQQLPPAQRPRRWLECPMLQRNAMGKWERQRWHQWLALLEAA